LDEDGPPPGQPSYPASVFWRYWVATATSGAGSALTVVAMPLTAVSLLHASAFEVGALTACGYIGWLLLTLPAGALASHIPLRGLQAAVDLIRGAAMLLPPVAYFVGSLSIVDLFASSLVVSLADVFAFVANTTYIPSVVPPEQLARRNSLMSATDAATQLGGPSLSGVIVQALGAPIALLCDAVSYVSSGLLMWTLPRHAQPSQPRRPMGQQIAEGWRFVIRDPIMRAFMLDATVTNFVCGALLTLTPLYLLNDLSATPSQYGLLVATEGVGALVGAAVTPRLHRRPGATRLVFSSAVAASVMLIMMPLGTGLIGKAVFAVANAGFAGCVVVQSILTRTYRQRASPPEMLARVMATVRFVSWSAIPGGGLLAGLLAGVIGPRGSLWVFAVASLASPIVLLRSPIRRSDLATA
jgi:MFS family permease